MGGYTQIILKDDSEDNIIDCNCLLNVEKVSKAYRFYSRNDARTEYGYFKIKAVGNYPEYLFPRNKINSYEDFLNYWNPKNCGFFINPFGALSFDCYFVRTPAIQMKRIANFLVDNYSLIKEAKGSFETFVERCGKSKEIQKFLLEKIKH